MNSKIELQRNKFWYFGSNLLIRGRRILNYLVASLIILAVVQSTAKAETAIAVATGLYHVCAITNTGAVKCWGDNSSGQLGDGTKINRTAPVSVVGLPYPATAIAAGYNFTCALLSNQSTRCWGSNSYGQLSASPASIGYSSTTPVAPEISYGPVTAIVLGASHACLLTVYGQVYCWGSNNYGQLNDGTKIPTSAATYISGMSNIAAIGAADGFHTCGVDVSGWVKCFGYNAYGQLGNGTLQSPIPPVTIAGLNGVTAVSGGSLSSCALTSSGTVKCWGHNAYGSLGSSGGNSLTPKDVVGITGGVVSLDTGGYHTCALLNNFSAKCWGDNQYGQLGNGLKADRSGVVNVSVVAEPIYKIATGGSYTCAITAHALKCWGSNFKGQLGNGTTIDSLTPKTVTGFTN